MEEIWKHKVGIKLTEESSIFKCNLGDIKVNNYLIDDKNEEESDMVGPDPYSFYR